MKRVVVVASVLAIVLSGAVGWKIYAQSEADRGPASGSGVVETIGVDVSVRIGARIRSIRRSEGRRVEEGDVLLSLECQEYEARLAEAQARLAMAEAQALGARAQAEAAARQSSAARNSATAAAAQLRALNAQRDIAERDAVRLESMGETTPVANRDRARSSAVALNAQARAARASSHGQRQQASARAASAVAAQRQSDAAASAIEAAVAAVRTIEIQIGECEIRAPRAGRIERIYFEEGELVMPGQVVARLVDPSTVRITFYLSNADITRAQIEGPVNVVADAYPDDEVRGRIRRIGLEAEFTPRNIQTRSDRDRLVFPVEVEAGDERLRAGMPVTVTLVENDG